MPEKSQKEMIQETHDATIRQEEMLKNISTHLDDLCLRVLENRKISTQNRIIIVSIVSLLVGAGVLDATNVIHIFGG